MTAPTGVGNIGVIDRRIGISARQHLVGISMAVLTICRGLAGSGDLCMRTVRVGVLRVSMAIGAQHFLRRRLVRKALHILVAVHAGQLHGAVNRVLHLFCIDEERHRLSVHVGGEGRVTVAGEAIFIFQLVLGASGEGRAQQKEYERTEQDSAGNFHGVRRRFWEFLRRDRSHRSRGNIAGKISEEDASL